MLNNNEELNYSEGDIPPYSKFLVFSWHKMDIVKPPPMEYNDDGSVCPSPLPDKVFYENPQGKAPVPKLDLSKAKKIQETIANKLNQAAQPNYAQQDPKAAEKIKQ